MNKNSSDMNGVAVARDQAWFCLRSQPKREHIAARNLKQIPGLELFNPRLRSRKLTTRGPVWFTESLFPNYLFARFELSTALEEVKFTTGVSHVLHFGDRYPVIPETVINDLRMHFGGEELSLSTEVPSEGETVTLAHPEFRGMQAKVLRILPAKQRVQVLLEMLGGTTAIELSLHLVMTEKKPLPPALFSEPALAR